MMILTNEALESIFENSHRDNGRKEIFREIAKVQLKEIAEWLPEYCTEHDHTLNISGIDHKVAVRHADCKECWQALLEEIK